MATTSKQTSYAPLFTKADIRAEYDRLDALCGISTKHIRIEISERAIKVLGNCHWTNVCGRCVPDYIRIAEPVLCDESLFWTVIRHEYAHALVDIRTGENHGHDEVWKRACLEVGCPPSRTTSTQDSEAFQAYKASKMKYALRCCTCGHEWKYPRTRRIIQLLEADPSTPLVCGHCHKTSEFELTKL